MMKHKLGSMLLAAALLLGTAAPAFAEEGFVGSPTLDPGASTDQPGIVVVMGDEEQVATADQPMIGVTHETEEIVQINTAYIESANTTEFFESFGAAADAKATAAGYDLDSFVQVRTVEVFANQLAIDAAKGEAVPMVFSVPGVEAGDVVMVAHFIQGRYAGSFLVTAGKGTVSFRVNLKELGTYMFLKQVKR